MEDILKKILRRLEVLNTQLNDIYDQLSDISSRREEPLHDEDDEVFPFNAPSYITRSEAERTRDKLMECFSTYGYLTVANVYDICGMENKNKDTCRYGWRDLPGLMVVRRPDYTYAIVFPAAKRI